uniref:Wsv216-like protein n=1 Tax=Melicertus latisulcatus pemonivirus TaxID=2984278 RepID=A0A9C7EYK1_9VIRU|nr:MAG: wsv216-like protein [Melicertus latisulcatus pemonivirus]
MRSPAVSESRWGVVEFATMLVLVLVTVVSALGITMFRTYLRPSKHSEGRRAEEGEGEEDSQILARLKENPPYEWIGHLGSALSNSGVDGRNGSSDSRSGVVDEVKALVNSETSVALADMTPNAYRDSLHRRITDRTYHVLGLPLDKESGSDDSQWPLMTETPFNTIEIRVGTQSAASASLHIIDGSIPFGETMPLILDIDIYTVQTADNNTDGAKEPGRLTYRGIRVHTLSNPILLQSEEGSSGSSTLEPGSRLHVEITESTRGIVYYSGPSVVQTPVPRISTVFSSQTLVVLRIEAPRSLPGERLVDYPSGTLNDPRYEDEFPRHMPVLNARGQELARAQLTLVAATATAESNQKRGPVTQLIYGNASGTANVTFDRSTYRSFVEASAGAKTSVTAVENPARPGEKYVVLSRVQDGESRRSSDDRLIGWSVGFISSDRGGGVNVVYSAVEEEPSLASTVDDTTDLVLYNTDRAVGIFREVDGGPSPEEEGTAAGGRGAPTSSNFFERDIEPNLLVRPDNGQVIALVHAPSDKIGAKGQSGLTTHLLPYNPIEAIPPVMGPESDSDHRHRHQQSKPTLKVTVVGGEATPTGLSSGDLVPHLLAIPCGQNSASDGSCKIVKVRHDMFHPATMPAAVEATLHFPRTGSFVRKRVRSREKSGQGLVVLDGIGDDDVADLKVSVIPLKGLPFSLQGPFGEYRISFAAKTKPVTTGPRSTSAAEEAAATLYVCRTSSKAATTDDGHRPPENILTLMGLTDWVFDKETPMPPKWALKGNGAGWGRHIFALALRYGEADLTLPLKAILDSGSKDDDDDDDDDADEGADRIAKYNSGAVEHARHHVHSHDYDNDTVKQAALASRTGSMDGLWVLGSDGSRIEKLLHDAFVVGPWGVVVFGANPSPPSPADEVDSPFWRNRSPLSLGGPGDILTDLKLPLRTVSCRLPVWRGGEPVLWVDGDCRAIVRLDPRIFSEGALIARGFEKKDNAGRVLLQVNYNQVTRTVHKISRLPLCTSASSPISKDQLRVLDSKSVVTRESVICVLSEQVPDNLEGITSALVDPIVFLCVAAVSSESNGKRVYDAVLGRGGHRAFHKRKVLVPKTFGAIAGFVLTRPE